MHDPMLKRATARGAVVVLLLTLVAPAALAQWVWRDASRQLHASDRPPPQNVPDKDIVQRPHGAARAAPTPAAEAASPVSAASSMPPGEAKPGSDPALEAKRRAAEQEKRASEAQAQQKNEVIRRENCARARTYQQTLDSGMRITRTNAQGEREVLDDAARADEAQRAKEVIARECR